VNAHEEPDGTSGIVELPSNRPAERFYRGGAKLAALRGEPSAASHEPEDWVASTTTVAGEQREGLTVLAGGRLLHEEIVARPVEWLGPEHEAAFGSDARLLAKLLDAGQRLPVHAHPDGAFACAELGRAHGKAEAWCILDGGAVHVGLRREVSREELLRLVSEQRTTELLDLLHRVEVEQGDVVFVPPGVLHAIGEGVLLFEVQEPEDLSILLEWEGFALDGERDGHLGLGFDRALAAVETRARTREEIAALVRRSGAAELLPAEAAPYFRLERHAVRPRARIDRGYAVLLVRSGEVLLRPERGDPLRLVAGATAVVPHAVGTIEAEGSGELILARPPLPGRRPGQSSSASCGRRGTQPPA
jgi:mannose-6-phosphate isomerase